MADMEEMAVLIKDQRAEIKALKHRLNQGEEAARNGNVWLEDVNLATNESVFVNPFEGTTRETMPRGFISNFKEMKQAAKESVQTKMKLVKTEAHVRELEVRGYPTQCIHHVRRYAHHRVADRPWYSGRDHDDGTRAWRDQHAEPRVRNLAG